MLHNKIIDWYLSRDSLPYWYVLGGDSLIVILSGVMAFAANHGPMQTFSHLGILLFTLVACLPCYYVGFRLEHTYSGIIRKSTFADLARLSVALVIGMVIVSLIRLYLPVDTFLQQLRFRDLILQVTLSVIIMCGMRVSIKIFYDPDTDDKDFNDLVLYTPREMTPASEDAIQWTVACEDLGGTFDYDFNDIVFRVKHVAGNDFLTIIPMAAGGTLPATLCYKNEAISEEWHQHFGNGYESNVMINTGMNTETVVWPIRLEGVPTDWSMKAFTSDPTAKDGDFSIVVERADGTKATVTGPSQGVAPQMLILPYEWQWPTELTRITTAYPNFGTWGSNYSNSSWVNSKVSDYVVPGFGEGQVTATKAAKTVTVK